MKAIFPILVQPLVLKPVILVKFIGISSRGHRTFFYKASHYPTAATVPCSAVITASKLAFNFRVSPRKLHKSIEMQCKSLPHLANCAMQYMLCASAFFRQSTASHEYDTHRSAQIAPYHALCSVSLLVPSAD